MRRLAKWSMKWALHGVRVPNGFALTVRAYYEALQSSDAWDKLQDALRGIDVTNVQLLQERGAVARKIVYDATGGEGLRREIVKAYNALERQYGPNVAVAVRSSATAEDLPTASFAGQHESYLNISGADDVVEACRECFASLFTNRAIVYRVNNGFDHFKVGLSVGVMKMVQSDRGASGVIFTLDTESGFRDVVLITGSYGLGENVVQGTVDPDEFYVHKPTYRLGKRCVLRRSLGQKQLTMTLAGGHTGFTTKNEPTPLEKQGRFCLTDAEALELADYAMKIEAHYSKRAGHPSPMDIEFAKDADDGRLYIVQARPETVASRKSATMLETYSLKGGGAPLVTGKAVGEKIGVGVARVITTAEDLRTFKPGEVLVAISTNPDWEPVMKTAGAIVTDHGGRTCHAAIVARELGVPAVVGTGNATSVLETGAEVTISCAGGEVGAVYAGKIPFDVSRADVGDLEMPKTKIMANLGNPDLAFRTAMMPNAGVGLARMEFIINEYIGVHPMALAHPERVSEKDRAAIAERARGFPTRREFFVRNLAEGVGTIAAAFYPKPVIIRLSDFKSNEYAELLGGSVFEPHEVQSDDRLPRRGALRASRLRRRLRPRMRGAEARARRHGTHQSSHHGAVLPPRERSRAGARDDGQARPQARRERARNLCDVRNPQQCDPGRRVLQGVRRLLDRLQRPDAIDPRRRSRFRYRRLRLRRARSRHDGDVPSRDHGGEAQRAQGRHLRRSAGQLS